MRAMRAMRVNPAIIITLGDDGTASIACSRGHVAEALDLALCRMMTPRPSGEPRFPAHVWQGWDSRYRRCRYCGAVERIQTAESERA